MADYLSPGVYVTETDYSEYVASVSSCIVGMVGEAVRGPVGIPTLITSQKEFIKTFGEPVEGYYGAYSALMFLTKGDQLYYTRIVAKGTSATAGEVGTDKLIYTAKAVGDAGNGITITQTEVDGETGTFSLTISKGDTTLESYDGLLLEGTTDDNVVIKLSAESNYIYATLQDSGTVVAKTLTLAGGSGVGGSASAGYATAGNESENLIYFRSKYPDSSINGGSVIISEKSNGYFSVTLKDSEGNVVEAWNSLTTEIGEERNVETYINKYSTRMTAFQTTGASAPEFEAETLIFSGGANGIEGISLADVIGEEDGTGLYSFSNPETVDVNILCAPGYYQSEVVTAITEICSDRGDCMAVIDPPFGLSVQGVLDWANGNSEYSTVALDSSYNATYYPWLSVPDTYTKKNIWLPPSGLVLAQYAYNDNIAAPWYAPAGLNRGVITKAVALEYSPTKAERDSLYGNRNVVNPIATFHGDGIVIWGQKTSQRKPTALDRINVRRLLNYLKKTIGASTKYFVFEQNNEATWKRWKLMVKPILENVKQRNGIEDYQIEIAPTTWEIENNIMPATVKIKPTKSAEFIPIDFQIMPQSAVFES